MTTATINPGTLVGLIISARRAGDREAEHILQDELRKRHGVTVRFHRPQADRRATA